MAINLHSRPRYWLSVEEEEVLRLLGVKDPKNDDIPENVLDSLEESLEAADDEFSRETLSSLLSHLEEEV